MPCPKATGCLVWPRHRHSLLILVCTVTTAVMSMLGMLPAAAQPLPSRLLAPTEGASSRV